MYQDIQYGIRFEDGSLYTFAQFLNNEGYHEFDIMEFTGLTDRNGVEIYEGDILHLRGYGNYEVTYDAPCFVTLYIGNITETFLSMNEFDNQDDAREYEVIGNIYENKELLDND